MAEYPEHAKLEAVREVSQAIGEFLDWLNTSKNYRICRRTGIFPGIRLEGGNEWEPLYLDIQSVLAEHFNINLDELEQEKRHMLESLRTQHLARDLATGN